MSAGEFWTKFTVWVALASAVVATALRLLAREPRGLAAARVWWTIGCAIFVVHVACAFGFYHHWSHAEAYRETARQTAVLTGRDWGGGLYWNYVFALAWLADVLWWWRAPASFARRSAWLEGLWQGFFYFMVFNATVVFGHGPVRIFGALGCGGLMLLALWRWRIAARPAGR